MSADTNEPVPVPVPENYTGVTTSVPSRGGMGVGTGSPSVIHWATAAECDPAQVTQAQIEHVVSVCMRALAHEAWLLQERTDWMSQNAGHEGVAAQDRVLDGPPLEPRWQDVAVWLARAGQNTGKPAGWKHASAIAVTSNGHPVTSAEPQ